MRKALSSLLIISFVLGTSAGAALPSFFDAPEAGDLVLRKTLQTVLTGLRGLYNLKGVSTAALLPDGRSYLTVSGWSNRDAGLAVTPELLFGIGSITKALTAALVLQLEEEGKLALDDRIGDGLPPIAHVDGAITLRQLLNHTSGVYDFTVHEDFIPIILSDPARKWAPEEVLRLFLREADFRPGEKFAYSNSNYVLLGLVIERAAGLSPAAEFRRRFFEPLALPSFYMEAEEERRGDLAHGWADLDGDGRLDDTSSFPKTSLYSAIGASGALFAAPADLAAWMKALFEGRILGPDALQKMMDVRAGDYGLGVFKVEIGGRTLWGHNGGTGEYATYCAYDSGSGITVAVFINQSEETTRNAEILIAWALLRTILAFQA